MIQQLCTRCNHRVEQHAPERGHCHVCDCDRFVSTPENEWKARAERAEEHVLLLKKDIEHHEQECYDVHENWREEFKEQLAAKDARVKQLEEALRAARELIHSEYCTATYHSEYCREIKKALGEGKDD